MNEILSNREANRIFSAWRKTPAIQRICTKIAFSGSHERKSATPCADLPPSPDCR